MTDYSNINITELAALVAEHLQHQGIEVVIVGGLAVEIYTENLYLTHDIDMVDTSYQPPKYLHAVMAQIEFRKQGRVFVNDTTDISIEFPPGPLSVGNELVKNITQKTIANKSIPILMVEDVVKDRLAAYIHWQDRQSLIQATTILLKHQLAPKTFQPFFEREGAKAEYPILEQLHRIGSAGDIQSMADLEPILAQLLIKNL